MRPLLLFAFGCSVLYCQTIDASRYPSLQAAIDAAPDHAIVQMTAGSYAAPAGITVRHNISLIGAGIERTFITVPPGWNQPVVTYDPSVTASSVEISGFTINLDQAKLATGLLLRNLGAPMVHHVRVFGGSIGLYLDASGSGHFNDLQFEDQDTVGIRINGDNGAEDHWSDITITRTHPGTLKAGFELLKTNTADLGGQYLSRVRVIQLLSGGGTIINGFRFVSTVPNSQIYLSCNQCIADAVSGGDVWFFQNVSDARLVNSWGASGATRDANFAGIRIDNSAIIQVSSSDFRSHSRDVAITGTVNLISFENNRFSGETTNVHMDRNGRKTALMFVANRYNALPTDDAEQLAGAAVPDPLSAAGMTVWTRDDMGAPQTLRIINQTSGGNAPAKHFRVNHSGQLEILNSDGTTPILTVDENGTAYANDVVLNGVSLAAKLDELTRTIQGLKQQIEQLQQQNAK